MKNVLGYNLLLCLHLNCFCYGKEFDKNGWTSASEYLRQAMDSSIDPCEDFYGFVCGKFDETNSNLSYHTTQYQKTREEVALKLISAINKIDVNNPNVPKFYTSLSNFYKKCTSTSYDVKNIIKDIYHSLDKYFLPDMSLIVNGTEYYPWELDDDNTFWNFVGKLQREQNTKFLIAARIENIQENCIPTPSLILSPRVTTLEKNMMDIFFSKVLGEYHNVTLEVNQTIETRSLIRKFAKTINEWHKKKTDLGQKLTIEKLKLSIPDIKWDSYLDGLLPEDIKKQWLTNNATVVIQSSDTFRQLTSLLKKFDHTTVYNYAYASVIQRYYNFFVRRKYSIDDSRDYFSDSSVQTDLCLDYAFRYFRSATARLLMDEYNVTVKQWKNDIALIAQSVFDAFRYSTYSMEWMSMNDKAKILKKLNEITFNGDLPDWLDDDVIVDNKSPEYRFDLDLIANDVLAQRKLHRDFMKPLIVGVMDELPPSFVTNAYYSNMNIRVLLGEQLPPYYRYTYPTAVKYGHYGWTVGHELLHGFDDDNIKENPSQVDPWLTQESLTAYLHSTLCFIQQFSQYCYKEHNKCLKGKVSINDNIADIEGIKIAYMAYKFASQTMPVEPLLDGEMNKYSWDKIFFMTAARQYCNSEEITSEDLDEDHAPAKIRVELSLSNFPSFAKAFNCRVGSKYAPIKTCSIWGSYWE